MSGIDRALKNAGGINREFLRGVEDFKCRGCLGREGFQLGFEFGSLDPNRGRRMEKEVGFPDFFEDFLERKWPDFYQAISGRNGNQ